MTLIAEPTTAIALHRDGGAITSASQFFLEPINLSHEAQKLQLVIFATVDYGLAQIVHLRGSISSLSVLVGELRDLQAGNEFLTLYDGGSERVVHFVIVVGPFLHRHDCRHRCSMRGDEATHF